MENIRDYWGNKIAYNIIVIILTAITTLSVIGIDLVAYFGPVWLG